MGVIGPALFDDDTAADVRGTYRAYIEQGIDDKEALRRILERYQRWFGREYGVGALVGFAVTQSELGLLDPEVRDQAIAAIDRGGDLQLWQRDRPQLVDKRRAVLSEARALLSAPQPPRAHLQVPSPEISDLVAGDVLALDVPSGLVIFRVVRVDAIPTHELPVLEQLEYRGSAVPPLDLLERLPKRDFPNPTLKDLGHCHIVVTADPGKWKQLGFRKIGRVQGREADSRRGGVYSTNRVSWSQILAYYQNSPSQQNSSSQ
jgi:hypothetical protein